ncbi:hypothetical protein FS842_001433 [Serendipita sp. 407]|nr:hypothetical protein FS842_001433 [Serendipita sp. 407]
MGKFKDLSEDRARARNNGRGVYNHSASHSSAYEIGKRGSAGKPAPSWVPNLMQRQVGTYDSRPNLSIREREAETFRPLEPEQGSRVFISGLPKDITDHDLEDFVSSTIGPVSEAYIIYQYDGDPLYKETADGVKRNRDAETSQNMRIVRSTGCGMVHFQRAKDGMEAWEKYHGKIMDSSNNNVLRIQIVIDADETWLIPRGDSEGEQNQARQSQKMEIEGNAGKPPSEKHTHVNNIGYPAERQRRKKPISTFGDLASRISPAVTSTRKRDPLDDRPILNSSDSMVSMQTRHLAQRISPRRRKKGPARLTRKGSVYRPKGLDSSIATLEAVSHAPFSSSRKLSMMQNLDDELEEYRKGGLMGSDKLHRSS